MSGYFYRYVGVLSALVLFVAGHYLFVDSKSPKLGTLVSLTAKESLALQKPYYAKKQNIFYGTMIGIQKSDYIFANKEDIVEK